MKQHFYGVSVSFISKPELSNSETPKIGSEHKEDHFYRVAIRDVPSQGEFRDIMKTVLVRQIHKTEVS